MSTTQQISLYKGKVKITFEEDRHIFRDEKGNILLSVTAITDIIDKSAPLMGWVAKMMGLYLDKNWNLKKIKTEQDKQRLIELAKKEYRRIKIEEANIGTEIHNWVSQWILGKKPEMPDDEKVINGITAFLRFQKERKFKWLESERIVFSKKYNYAGILDAVAKEGKKLVLVDFKSSNGIYDEMRFQVAGYQIAYEEETGKKIDKTMIIKFGKDTGEFEAVELEDHNKDKKAFLAALEVKKRLKELNHK